MTLPAMSAFADSRPSDIDDLMIAPRRPGHNAGRSREDAQKINKGGKISYAYAYDPDSVLVGLLEVSDPPQTEEARQICHNASAHTHLKLTDCDEVHLPLGGKVQRPMTNYYTYEDLLQASTVCVNSRTINTDRNRHEWLVGLGKTPTQLASLHGSLRNVYVANSTSDQSDGVSIVDDLQVTYHKAMGAFRRMLWKEHATEDFAAPVWKKKWDSSTADADALPSATDLIQSEIERLEDGWDGDGSAAPTAAARQSLAEVIPLIGGTISSADIEVDPSGGEISFKWFSARTDQALAITILGSGKVIAVHLGAEGAAQRWTFAVDQLSAIPRAIAKVDLR